MRRLRVLFVEDNPDDVELILHELAEAGYACEWQRVETAESFRSALRNEPWDIVLADFNMPRFDAPRALELLEASGRDIPFIIVSGSVGEDTAALAMQAGAQDFFDKTRLTRLVAAIERELRDAEVRRERHQLRRSEDRYRLIVENVRDYAIFMLDLEGRVASWNHAAARLIGYAEPEVLGQSFAVFFTEEDRRAGVPEAALQQASAAGSYAGEGEQVQKDGGRFWAASTVDRLVTDGGMLGYTVVFRDISERKALLDDLRLAVQARDEFLSVASHELKTPLTTLELQLERLGHLKEKEPDLRISDEKVAAKLATAERQAVRLSKMVGDLIDVARATSGRLDLHLEPVELVDVVQAVLPRMREAIEKAGCEVRVRASGPTRGTWDRSRLEAAVMNLLSNAARFGQGRPIEVVIEGDEERVRLHVRDHGRGIGSAERARVFERLDRVVPEEHYGGFGIGLWIVRQITEAHRGTVSVDSDVGAGSTFTISLPTLRG